MTKIYLAAKFERQVEMRGIRDRLIAAGHEVTSRWLTEEHSKKQPTSCALIDVEDIRDATMLITFSEPRGSFGGGRNVEFGIALERKMDIVVIGPKGEHVFHHLPLIVFFETFDEFMVAVEAQRRSA